MDVETIHVDQCLWDQNNNAGCGDLSVLGWSTRAQCDWENFLSFFLSLFRPWETESQCDVVEKYWFPGCVGIPHSKRVDQNGSCALTAQKIFGWVNLLLVKNSDSLALSTSIPNETRVHTPTHKENRASSHREWEVEHATSQRTIHTYTNRWKLFTMARSQPPW